jgi:hypothetical protein
MTTTAALLWATLNAVKDTRLWIYLFAGREDADRDGEFGKLAEIQAAIMASRR